MGGPSVCLRQRSAKWSFFRPGGSFGVRSNLGVSEDGEGREGGRGGKFLNGVRTLHGWEEGETSKGRESSKEEASVTFGSATSMKIYRAEKKSWYGVARNFFLLLLNFSAWPCLALPGCCLAKFAKTFSQLCKIKALINRLF